MNISEHLREIYQMGGIVKILPAKQESQHEFDIEVEVGTKGGFRTGVFVRKLDGAIKSIYHIVKRSLDEI